MYGERDSNAPPPLAGCFGVEGVEVTVTGADGRVLSAVTNRAGNVYFEGSPSELVLPYTGAAVHWNDNGVDSLTNMFVQPSYGGCARCHTGDRSAPITAKLDSSDPDFVLPAQVIFLPRLTQ